MNDVIFQKQSGGLGRALAGADYLSAMMFFTGTLPSGFTTTYNKKQVFSVSDAEALGIVDTYSDETKAASTWEITTAGSTGDITKIDVVEPNIDGTTTTVTLCTYTKVAGDSTIALLGASIAAAINAGTYSHGYTAAFATATLTITARPGLGIALNSGTPVVITITGTTAGTLTQFTGGAYSKLAVWHYHISEYFRIQPQGNLWLGFYPVPSTYNFTELQDLQTFAGGTIRQTLIFHLVARTAGNVASDCTAIQAVNATLETLHMPMSVIYAPNIKAISDLSTLTNLGLLTAPKSSVCIAQDGGGLGALLYLTSGISITTGGACLGAVSLASVAENIGWISKFPISNGVECDTIAFSNGALYTSISASLKEQLNAYRYIFLTSQIGITGSFFNDSHTAVATSSDYAYIENNRTIDKAIRVGRAALLPELNSPLKLNANGTLTNATIAHFTGLLNTAEAALVRNDEISAFEVTIDPAQNVLATSILYVTLKIVPIGVARQIIVKIGFTTAL